MDARVPIFKMFHPSSNTAHTHAHTSISMLKSLVNFCSRDFLFNEKFDDSMLVKRHIIVGHFVRSDTDHAMQATDVTRQSRKAQQLVPSTTLLSFVCCSRFACKKEDAHDFRYNPRILNRIVLLVGFIYEINQSKLPLFLMTAESCTPYSQHYQRQSQYIHCTRPVDGNFSISYVVWSRPSLSLKKWTSLGRSAGYSRQDDMFDMKTAKEIGNYN